jgi:hypothetical protein
VKLSTIDAFPITPITPSRYMQHVYRLSTYTRVYANE